MIWKCEDCHELGVYFDKTEREVAEEHAKTCEATRAALARLDSIEKDKERAAQALKK